jgi:chemotaxis protein histidine kinase CheA
VDHIKSQLDTLAELSDEQVAELQTSIISEFEAVEGEDPTSETVDVMTSLADALDNVRGELSRRESLAAELASKAAEATARVKGAEDVQEDGEAMAEYADADEKETPAEDEMASDAEVTEDMPAEDMPEEAPAEEMPADEMADEEEKKEEEDEDDKAMSASAETETSDVASTTTEEGSELSTEEETSIEAETVVEESAVVEAVEESAADAELSAEETPEVTEEAVAEEAPVADEAPAEEVPAEVTEASTQQTEFAQEEQEGQAPVTAAAEESFAAPADRQPVIQVTEAPVAITAGADIPGYTAGSTINDMYEVASAMEKRIHSLRRVNGGDGEQHIVASVTTSFPESRTLSTDAESNSAKISAVVGQEALVASGGHAAPLEVKYDIFSQGSTTVRPVRDSLPRFQADRGGIRFVTPPSFAAGTYANAVGVWTAANDSAETPNPSAKTSLTVAAAAEQTVSTDAVTLQLQFGNLMTRAYPELIARHNELALVQHAREAEQNLLTNIGAASTAVTTTNLIGFGRDFLVQIRRAATAYRSRHRISPDARLKAIVPAWVYDAMAADLTLSMPGDNTLAVSQAEINGYLGTLNVDLVASLDATVFGSQGATALLEFPDSFDWFLFAEGTFLFLDGGTLDLGIIRDSSLVGTNDYKMFIETFENVAKVGIESLKITSTISINGVAAALRDTTGGAAAATIEL